MKKLPLVILFAVILFPLASIAADITIGPSNVYNRDCKGLSGTDRQACLLSERVYKLEVAVQDLQKEKEACEAKVVAIGISGSSNLEARLSTLEGVVNRLQNDVLVTLQGVINFLGKFIR